MTNPKISVEAELQDPQQIDAEHAADTVAPDEAAGLTFPLDRTIDRVMDSLTPRERKVLGMRRSLTDEPVTQERIREIEKKALDKLRHRQRNAR